ncbi:MAG: hypothetical protein ACLFNY_06215 [Candidatus Aenigmatarchaeota archaeon]
MCIFIEDWDCNFAGQEITLDICKTCIDAKRLYHETRHDRALQERKKRMEQKNRMEQMSREREPERDIVPERPKEKPKERPKRKDTAQSPKIEDRGLLDALQEQAFADKSEDKGILDSLQEETSKNKVQDESSMETLEPVSIIEMENLEGSLEDIRNDPTRPTDTWLEATEDGETSFLKAEFPNPPDQLQAGEDRQEFLVRVRRTQDEVFFPPYPEINVKVCEDDDVVTETGRTKIEDVHGEVVSLKWDAGRLLDLYGTDVEIIVEGFGAGDDGIKNRIEIGAIGWRARLVKSTSEVESSDQQTLEERLLSPLEENSNNETIETIRSDINPLE